MKKRQTKFKTFNTECSQCEVPIAVTQFNVHIGAASFALCQKHLDEMLKREAEFVSWLDEEF